MKRFVVALFAVALVFGTAFVLHAATADEAKALSQKAATFIKANGKDKGLAEVGNPKGQFMKGDLYVTVSDLKGTLLANPAAPTLVGKNGLGMPDANGKDFVKECIEIATTKGGGWISYSWSNPVTKKVQGKKAWVQKVEGADMYAMAGIWE